MASKASRLLVSLQNQEASSRVDNQAFRRLD